MTPRSWVVLFRATQRLLLASQTPVGRCACTTNSAIRPSLKRGTTPEQDGARRPLFKQVKARYVIEFACNVLT